MKRSFCRALFYHCELSVNSALGDLTFFAGLMYFTLLLQTVASSDKVSNFKYILFLCISIQLPVSQAFADRYGEFFVLCTNADIIMKI